MKVEDRVFMARICEQGGQHEDMIEYIVDMFRKKDQQKVRVEFVK